MVDYKDGEKTGVKVIPKGQPIPTGYTPPPLQPMPQVHLPTITAEVPTVLPPIVGEQGLLPAPPLYAAQEPTPPLAKIRAQPPDTLAVTPVQTETPLLHRRSSTSSIPNPRGPPPDTRECKSDSRKPGRGGYGRGGNSRSRRWLACTPCGDKESSSDGSPEPQPEPKPDTGQDFQQAKQD